MYIFLIIVLLGTTIFFVTNNDIELKTVQSVKGKIDLKEWNESTLLKLTGDWQYYDNLMINDIEKSASEEYVYVLHTFKKNENVGNNPYGTATYKLIISGLNKEVNYGIQINDEYGHSVGDEILKESAKRLRESFHRETDILCRYGGDEFVAFVSVKDNDRNIEGIINRIKESFAEPFLMENNNFFITVSIGVSEFHNGDDMEKTIHSSDYAMYAEKQSRLKAVFETSSI